MCKLCLRPIYGGDPVMNTVPEWGRKSSTSDYYNPLDLSSQRDLQKPLSPRKLQQQTKLTKSASLQEISQELPDRTVERRLTKSVSIADFPTGDHQSDPVSNQISTQSLCLPKASGRLDQSVSKLDAIDEDQSKVLLEEEVFERPALIGEDGLNTGKREIGTLTDVHYQDNVAEVDLISLVEEQIPKYVLRADSITDFTGYDNRDFGRQKSRVPANNDLDLSPEIIEETLKYFILCAERVSQMNRTYNDIEAVTRLLEEKETDLELAARIGQGLLEKNKKLEEKNEVLEETLTQAYEKISQLRHELNMKDALLQSYNEDYELDVDIRPLEGSVLDRSVSQCDNLQKKVKVLEDENVKLKQEAEQLTAETCDLEEKEVTLVSDCVRQLDDANRKIKELEKEMKAKADVCVAQQEDNTNLMSKVITVESNYKKQLAENAELSKQMKQMQVTQMELTSEIFEMEEKYEETMALLDDKCQEMKSLRKKNNPSVIHQHYGTSPFFRPEGSLALEIEKSETEEMCPDGYTPKQRKKHLSKVLETAKTVNRAIGRHNSQASLSSLSIHSMLSEDSRNSICMSDTLSVCASDSESAMSESFSQTDIDSAAFGSGVLGKPGIPGSNDLETALRRLAIRQANEINQSYLDQQDHQNGNITARTTGDNTPTPCPTPDSYMSTGSASLHSSSLGGYKIPEKLQIVKPLEGSQTLHHWQRLATPRLEGLLECRPGVQIRGEKPDQMDEEIYALSDYEEDDDLSYLQAKAVDNTAGTFTYTTAKIMHPTDEYDTLITNVHSSAKVSSTSAPKKSGAKRPNSLPLTHTTMSSEGTSTFSMSFNLAAMLHERGLQEGMDKYTHRQKHGFLSRMTSWITAPQRFSSITTEKLSETANSQTETIYTQSSMYIPPLKGISASDEPMPYRPEEAYLNLVDKVRELGLSNVMGIASNSGISPVKKDPIDVGLNTVMFIRRNRVTGAPTRASAQTLVSSSRKKSLDHRESPTAVSVSKKLDNSPVVSNEPENNSSVKQNKNNSTILSKYNSALSEGLSSQSDIDSSALSSLSEDQAHSAKDSVGKVNKDNGTLSSIGLLASNSDDGVLHRVNKDKVTSISLFSSDSDAGTLQSVPSFKPKTEADKSVNNFNTAAAMRQEHYGMVSSPVLPSGEGSISHSKISGLSYAVTPPNLGSASVARDRVYTSLATGRRCGATMVTGSGYSIASINSHSNVGTGTIHQPLSRENTSAKGNNQNLGQVIDAAAKVGQGSRSGITGSAAKVLNVIKPQSSGLLGALTSTPIAKNK